MQEGEASLTRLGLGISFGPNRNVWPCHALSWQWSLEFIGPKDRLIAELYLLCIWHKSSFLKMSCIQRNHKLAPSVEGQGFGYKMPPIRCDWPVGDLPRIQPQKACIEMPLRHALEHKGRHW